MGSQQGWTSSTFLSQIDSVHLALVTSEAELNELYLLGNSALAVEGTDKTGEWEVFPLLPHPCWARGWQ